MKSGVLNKKKMDDVKTIHRYIGMLLLLLLLASIGAYGKNELRVMRKSVNSFDVQLTTSEDVLGVQFRLQTSGGVSLGNVVPGTLPEKISSMVSSYRTNDSTVNVLILNGRQTIFPQGSGSLVSIDFTFANSLKQMMAKITQVMVINAKGDSIGVTTMNYVWTETGSSSPQSDVPQSFVLGQNYPNPFNPSTMLKYRLQSQGQVRLSIYDIRGCEVTRLVDQFQNQGDYEIEWKSKSDAGYTMSSGMYIARLTVNNVSVSRKILLTK